MQLSTERTQNELPFGTLANCEPCSITLGLMWAYKVFPGSNSSLNG